MAITPKPESGRFLAIVLLLIAILLIYFLGVHWWFTARHLEIAGEIESLREQELHFREIAATRKEVEAAHAAVRNYEANNPAFLPETDFDSAAASLNAKVKQIVARHAPAQNPDRCAIVMNQYQRSNEPERFERVLVKLRLRCDLEPFAAILHDLESSSPLLFVDDLQVFRQQGYLTPGSNKIQNYLDIRLDVFGYIRTKPQPEGKEKAL
ncbi:type II secretion system protein GspM [Ahniella affigens]|uniref:type II secretion system protein GspM n=1 Tax=Ahniella affigens TaxID=2021234 RepID=UPI0014745C74|nr:type II secretion system protein GspM [Ahniella affigens]